MAKNSLEAPVLRAIMEYLEYKRYLWWRNQSGGIAFSRDGVRRFVRLGKVGSPDIFVLYKGKLYGIEVKSITGKQSAEQKKFEQEMIAEGGIYKVCRSIDDVEELL